MDPLLIVLRVVHVVGGVFWGGAILFVVHFLEPAVRDAGPDGAKVMQALQKRRYLDVMPVVAALTVVSGYWLYWRVFGRWHPGPGASGAELWLGVGGFAIFSPIMVFFRVGWFPTGPTWATANRFPSIQHTPAGVHHTAPRETHRGHDL